MNNKITITAAPYARSPETIETVMSDVIIALLPACAAGVYIFGVKALSLFLISIAACVFFEFIFQIITKKPVTVTDLSAVVTGILLAANLPVAAPLWLAIVGGFVAIIIVKQLFGGLGQNFINPALLARAFLQASYPREMTNFTVDSLATATPLALLKNGNAPTQTDYINAFFGNIGGCIGEVCAPALLIGGVYLLARRVISWRTPVTYILTVGVLSQIIGRGSFAVPFYEIITGGLLLGAIFMATDYASSPVTPNGKIVAGILCGVLTVIIRVYGGYPEGVSYSILLMNLAAPLIDRLTRPRVFGKKRGGITT